jgi:hypothetical protein
MQDSLIGLWHLERARTPSSARQYSGSGWMDGMMLALDQAGARHSQSPVKAYIYWAVMETLCSSGFQSRWSILVSF